MKRWFLVASLLFATLLRPASAWAHLLITEVGYDTVNESGTLSSEYVEIVNPGPGNVSLDNVWIVNDEPANYPSLVNGALTGVVASDWVYRFPPGTTLAPSEVAVVTWNSSTFMLEFPNFPAGARLFETIQDGSGDGVPDMINWGSNVAFNFSLTNSSECVGLATWDGASDLIQDIDWVCWGTGVAGLPNKDFAPGSIDGPDPDTIATSFAPDAWTGVPALDAPEFTSINRPSPNEPGEIASGGNGVTGHDETSENWSAWTVLPYSPGVVDLCSAQSTQCATSSLDLSTGTCVLTPKVPGTACNDGNLCTAPDTCDGFGSCTGTLILCDDSDVCTDDSCDMANGFCVFTDNTASCDDGDACTAGDQCSSGVCAGNPISCDDSDVCTVDSCDAVVGCEHTTLLCDDNNACTKDSCDAMTGCQTAAVMCNDGNACTTDSCDPISGCQTAPVMCDDSNACTTDSCDSISGCQTAAVMCDDGNACTTDSCDPSAGCQAMPVSCDDNDACTLDMCLVVDGRCSHLNTCGGAGGRGGAGGTSGQGGSAGMGQGGTGVTGGQTGTGGNAGAGGAGQGGSGATGGATGSGGQGASGGMGASTSSASTTTGQTTSGSGGNTTGDPGDEGGCACSAVGSRSGGQWPATLFALALGLRGLRTRRTNAVKSQSFPRGG